MKYEVSPSSCRAANHAVPSTPITPTRRAVLTGGVALLAGASGARRSEAADRVPLAATPISRLTTPWWRERHLEKVARLRSGRVDLAWYGDSITQDWEKAGPQEWLDFAPVWDRFYGDRNAVNLGFKGDNTAHLLWRIQNGQAEGISPRAAVVLIGANNLGRVRWNASQTVAGIEAVVGELRRRLPRTRLLLLGVLPSERSKWVTRTTNDINTRLAELSGNGAAPGLSYMDVGGIFLHDGRVDRSQYYDPLLNPPEPVLHPTAQAQARIAAAIEPTLAAMMGDRSKVAR